MKVKPEIPIKKPLTKLRTSKCSFKSILKQSEDDLNKNIFDKLFDATCRTNQIIFHTYQLLRLWILDKYENNIEIPIITENTIRMGFKCLIKKTCGPKL